MDPALFPDAATANATYDDGPSGNIDEIFEDLTNQDVGAGVEMETEDDAEARAEREGLGSSHANEALAMIGDADHQDRAHDAIDPTRSPGKGVGGGAVEGAGI